MSTSVTVYLTDVDEARMRLVATETGRDPTEIATAAVQGALLNATRDLSQRFNKVYTCPVCCLHDPAAYLRCNRPDCTDGRDPR